MNLNIQIHGVDQFLGAMRDAVLRGARNGVEKLGIRGVQLAQSHEPVGATGMLMHGTFAEMHQDGPLMHDVISVGPPADVYAAPVEDGTRPHMPPTSALVLWVQKKLHVANEKQATSIAFAIARTIARRGTKGAHMFELAFAQLEKEAQGIVEREIALALESAGFGEKS